MGEWRLLGCGLALLLVSGCAAVANTATGSTVGSTNPAPSDCVSLGGSSDNITMSVVRCEGATHRVDAVEVWPGDSAVRLGTKTLACDARHEVIVSKQYDGYGRETQALQLYYCVSVLTRSNSGGTAGREALPIDATPRRTPPPFVLPPPPTPPVWLYGDPSLTERELDACQAGRRLEIDISRMTFELVKITLGQFSGNVRQVRRAGKQVQGWGNYIVRTVGKIERSGLGVPDLRPIRDYGQAVARLGAVARKVASPGSAAVDRARKLVDRRGKASDAAIKNLKRTLSGLDCGWPY